jgi:hypothetical protein
MTAVRETPRAVGPVPERAQPVRTARVVGVRGRLILGPSDVLADDVRRLPPALKWRTEARRPAHR